MDRGISLLKLLNRKVPSTIIKKAMHNYCSTFPPLSNLILVHKQFVAKPAFASPEFYIFLQKRKATMEQVALNLNELVLFLASLLPLILKGVLDLYRMKSEFSYCQIIREVTLSPQGNKICYIIKVKSFFLGKSVF